MLRSILTYSGAFAFALLISCPVVAMRVDSKTKAEAKQHADREFNSGVRRVRGGGFNARRMTWAELEAEYINQKMGALAKIEEVLRKTQKVVKKVDQPVGAVPQIRCVDEFSDEER